MMSFLSFCLPAENRLGLMASGKHPAKACRVKRKAEGFLQESGLGSLMSEANMPCTAPGVRKPSSMPRRSGGIARRGKERPE
jgi:hypothetical protein